MFSPKLPHKKIKAIENLGFGAVNKIFLVFDRPPLGKDYKGLQILWREDLNMRLNESVNKWNIEVSPAFKNVNKKNAILKNNLV